MGEKQMIPRLGLDPSTLAIVLDELFRSDEMRVGVKRAGVYGAHSQRIEGIMLENSEHPTYPRDTAQLTEPMDMLVVSNVVENASGEGHVERIVWGGDAVILNLQARRGSGKALFCNLQAARRNIGTCQPGGGEIPPEVGSRIAYS